ncbi:MAG: hypothetical protein V4598_13780 [Bdellovibrionota bacterium]
MLKYLTLMLLIASCASPEPVRVPSSTPYQRTWHEYVFHNFIDKNGLEKYFPDPEYLKEWQENSDFVLNNPIQPFRIQEKAFSCKVRKVYPTHPSQSTKEYLYAVYNMYDHGKIPPSSYACLRKNPTGRFCVRAASAIMAVMSDTYEDECGNFYRGYWLVTYLKSDESMGTLFAKGRSAYEKPNAQFRGEFVEDGTHFLAPKEFMLFGDLVPGDVAKIRAEKARALRSGFRMNGKLFVK